MARQTDISVSQWLLLAMSSIAISGCGTPQPATGTASGAVRINGEPLEGGMVCLTDETNGCVVLGTVEGDGSFTLRHHATPNVPCGKYKVTVGGKNETILTIEQVANKEFDKITKAKNLVPLKYRMPTTSDLVVEIKPGENPLAFDLE